jgi:multidrug efflux pump subunit AcrB
MGLTAFALRNQPLLFMLVAAMALTGLSVSQNFPSQEDPPILVREAVITTFYPGMEPEKVERIVTRQIEKAMARITERKHITSYSWPGHSEVHIEIQDQYTNLDEIWTEVRNKVDDVAPRLPEGVIGPFVNDDFGDVTVVSVALLADGFSLAQMYEVAKRIQDEIYLVPGVGRVQIYGVQNEVIWLEFNSSRLAQLGFAPSTIRDALRTQNIILPSGTIDTGQRELRIHPTGMLRDVEQIKNIRIRIPGTEQVVYLRDLATVTRGYVDPPETPFYYDGEQGLLLGVTMVEGENVLDVGPRIRERVEAIEASLPIGYSLEIGNYQPTHVQRAVKGVRDNLFQTVIIVLIVIVVFLGPRTGLIVGLHVPLTMVITLVLMYVSGVAMQRISLATLIISLGLLVDNGIVVAEEIGRRLRAGEDRMQATIDTGKTLSVPLLTSSITTILMFVPLALAPHAVGEYLRSMSVVIFMALLTSWVLAMTVTTTLCYRYLKPDTLSDEELAAQMDTLLYRGYRGLLESILRIRVPFLVAMLGLLVGGFGLFSLVPVQFMPESDRPQILVDVKLPAGYGIRETKRRIEDLVAWLEDEEQNPEVVQTLTYVGNGGVRFFVTIAPEPSGSNMGFILITVPSLADVEPVMNRLRRHAQENLPTMSLLVKRMFLGSVETGLVEARVYGPDREALVEAGREVAVAALAIPGTLNVYSDWESPVTEAKVIVDQSRARRAGVTSRDIAASLQTLLDGTHMTVLREGDEEISIVGRAEARERYNVDRLFTAIVFSPQTGSIVPLVQVADFKPVPEFSVIRRRDHSPAVVVSAKSLSYTATELQDRLAPDVDRIVEALGTGFRWEWGGETESSADAQAALGVFLPICLFGVLICLVAQFNGFKSPAVIVLTIPLAIGGVSIGLLAMGGFLSFMATLGILALIGIVINNAIVMIDQIRLEAEAGASPYDSILQACQNRLRPILMTTLTTVLGMAPIIISRDPLFYDMATAIAFGLAFGTLLTLGVAPVLYAVFYRIPSPQR